MLDQLNSSCLVDDNLYKSMVADSIPNESTSRALDETSSLSDFLGLYEDKMMKYIYAIPHIPPTLFELKLRHADVKGGLLKMYGDCLRQNTVGSDSIQALCQRLNAQIDKLFASVVVKNMNEYKVCQTGFIIGWKCNVNKPRNHDLKSRAVDDRF